MSIEGKNSLEMSILMSSDMLKPLGWRKRQGKLWQSKDEVWSVIEFQRSQNQQKFAVNLGVISKAIFYEFLNSSDKIQPSLAPSAALSFKHNRLHFDGRPYADSWWPIVKSGAEGIGTEICRLIQQQALGWFSQFNCDARIAEYWLSIIEQNGNLNQRREAKMLAYLLLKNGPKEKLPLILEYIKTDRFAEFNEFIERYSLTPYLKVIQTRDVAENPSS